MKIKNRLLLDGLMLLLIFICMKYNFTGGLFHEILGLVLILGFLAHIYMNRKAYVVLFKKLLSGKSTLRWNFVLGLNLFMAVDAVVMLISSLAISKNLVPAVSNLMGNYETWHFIHVLSATLMLVAVCIHTCLHGKLFASLIKRFITDPAMQGVFQVSKRVLAVVLVLAVVKTSFTNALVLGNTTGRKYHNYDNSNHQTAFVQGNTQETEESEQYFTSPDSQNQETEESQQSITNPDSQNDEETSLNTYLGNLYCSGCGRHCSLLSPRCGKGRMQAQQATESFNASNSEGEE